MCLGFLEVGAILRITGAGDRNAIAYHLEKLLTRGFQNLERFSDQQAPGKFVRMLRPFDIDRTGKKIAHSFSGQPPCRAWLESHLA